MKLLNPFRNTKKKEVKKTDAYQDVLVAFGRDQLELLAQKGLRIRGISV